MVWQAIHEGNKVKVKVLRKAVFWPFHTCHAVEALLWEAFFVDCLGHLLGIP